MELMRVDLELNKWDPWKAMAAAFGAGATFTGAIVAIIVALVRLS